MSNNDGWMTLWQFTRSIDRRRVTEVEVFSANWNSRTLTFADYEQAQLDVLRNDPPIPLPGSAEWLEMVDQQVARNRTRRRFEIDQLMTIELPAKIREALASGKYEVTARRMVDQALVTLEPRSRAVLTADLQLNQLVGSAGSYGEIAIRPVSNLPPAIETEAVQIDPPLPPAPTRPHRCEYLPDLRIYLVRHPELLANLDDVGIAKKFRSYMRVSSIHLPARNSYIASQIGKIRSELAVNAQGAVPPTAEEA